MTPSNVPVASSSSEVNTSTINSEISALLLFLDHCARSASTPTNTVSASELRRLFMTPQRLTHKKYRTARDPRPGPLFWARKGERAQCPEKYRAEVTVT